MNFIVVAEEQTWAEDLSGILEATLPIVNSTVVLSVEEANVFLSASTFDAVFVAHKSQDAWGEELYDAFIQDWSDRTPLILVAADVTTRGIVEALRAGFVEVFDETDLIRNTQELGMRILAAMQQRPTREGSTSHLAERLEEIRAKASKVYHDVNNPLAIVSGNAQLFLELSNILGADEDLVQPVRDIDAASMRMSELLRGLVEIKQLASADAFTKSGS